MEVDDQAFGKLQSLLRPRAFGVGANVDEGLGQEGVVAQGCVFNA